MALTQVSTDGIKNGTITGSDLATNIDLADNQRLRLGTGNDLEIFHNNDNSFINDSGTGQLMIQASGLRLRNYPEGHTQVNCQDDVVELYYNNSKKFQTDSDGVEIFGNRLRLADNVKAAFGSGADLQIYHDGNHSYIQDAGTGSLILVSNQVVMQNAAQTENMFAAIENAGCNLYYDNVKKFETTSTGATVAGDLAVTSSLAKIKLNDTDGGDQYQIRNDAGTFIIRNGTDSKSVLTIDGNCVTSILNATPPATGVSVLHVSDGGSATTLGTAATFRVSNNGGNGAYSVFEAGSTLGYIRLANDGQFYVTGASTFNGDIRVDRGTAGIDGIVGQAYSGYFGLKHADQTINSEYMILNNNTSTFISCSSGYNIYIRPSANSQVHETIFAHNTTTFNTNLLVSEHNIQRTQHHTGHLEGGYNNIGGSETKTNPIFTIGSAYNPNEGTLSNMYGVGYSKGDSSFLPTGSNWGFYAAAAGVARIFLDTGSGQGRIYFGGNLASEDRFISHVTGEYGSMQISNGEKNGWGGFSIDGHSVFMSNGSATGDYLGLYDDNANKWHLLSQRNAWLRLYHNSNVRLETTNAGVYVTGTLSLSGNKSFRIPHPLSELSETKDLVHAAIEGPQSDLMYRGKVDLVNGTATVNIDTKSGMTEGTFDVLNRDVQCFTTNETGWINVKGSVTGNKLTIVAEDNSCTDTISWMVIGERKDNDIVSSVTTDDNGSLIVEPDKQVIDDDPKMDD